MLGTPFIDILAGWLKERIPVKNNKIISLIILGVLVAAGVSAVTLKNKDNEADNKTDVSISSNKADNQTNQSSSKVETNKITYKGFEVVQKIIKVKKGTTVTWTNQDSAKHDVTPVSETEEFKASELFGKGGTYSVTFNTVGTYKYFCSPHPYMKGTIEVIE